MQFSSKVTQFVNAGCMLLINIMQTLYCLFLGSNLDNQSKKL